MEIEIEDEKIKVRNVKNFTVCFVTEINAFS